MEKKKLKTLLTIVIIASLLAGCGSSKSEFAVGTAVENASMAQDAAMEEAGLYDTGYGEYEQAAPEAEQAQAGGQAEVSKTPQAGRKLITTMDLSAETESFDELMGTLEGQVAALGGYIESSDQWNGSVDYYGNRIDQRNASLTIRIPAEKLDSFVAVMGEKSNIVRKGRSVEDVTLAYVDLESHKKALITAQDRLMELLKKAETVEDLIAIEDKLANVRYQLESMESQLRTYDNRINYSTVYLNIQEVKHLTPPEEMTTWGKIKSGFAENVYYVCVDVRDFFVRLLINIPYIALWLVILAVVLLFVFLLAKHGKKGKLKRLLKRQKPAEMKTQERKETLSQTGDLGKETTDKEE